MRRRPPPGRAVPGRYSLPCWAAAIKVRRALILIVAPYDVFLQQARARPDAEKLSRVAVASVPR